MYEGAVYVIHCIVRCGTLYFALLDIFIVLCDGYTFHRVLLYIALCIVVGYIELWFILCRPTLHCAMWRIE